MKKWSWRRFGYGVLGAAAPEVLRMVRKAQLPLAHPYLIGISILSVLIGGVFADAWDDDQPIKCIYIGATFPVWLSSWSSM